jgi:tetratricopeptide (TPR) repeat protein
MKQGDYEYSERRAQSAVDLARSVRNAAVEVDALIDLAAVAGSRDDWTSAQDLLESALGVARHAGDESRVGQVLANLTDAFIARGQYEQARKQGLEALELSRRSGDLYATALSLYNLALTELNLGRVDDAALRLEEAFAMAEGVPIVELSVWCLEGMAAVAAERGQLNEAVRLLDAAASRLGSSRFAIGPAEAALRASTSAKLEKLRRSS